MPQKAHPMRGDGAGTSKLAIDLVPILAGRVGHRADPGLLARFVAAAQRPDPRALPDLAFQARRDGVSEAAIVGRLIPETARVLGRAWCEDGTSFAAVTIGCARLNALLHSLARPRPAGRGPAAIVVIRRGRQHSLGASVAAAILRGLGVDATLSSGRPDLEVLEMAREGRFGMIALSVPLGSDLEADAAFVRSLRRAAPATPIAVGGGAVEGSEGASRIALGADHATTDIAEAARLCGLIEAEPIGLRSAGMRLR